MEKKLEKKFVEIAKKRVPLRKIIHGKEIREAAKALEDFRLNFNEEEMLYGATLKLKWEVGGDAYLYALRLETDNEFNKRVETARIAAEQRAERERVRKIQAEEKAKRAEANRKQTAFDTIMRIAKDNGLSDKELAILLKTAG